MQRWENYMQKGPKKGLKEFALIENTGDGSDFNFGERSIVVNLQGGSTLNHSAWTIKSSRMKELRDYKGGFKPITLKIAVTVYEAQFAGIEHQMLTQGKIGKLGIQVNDIVDGSKKLTPQLVQFRKKDSSDSWSDFALGFDNPIQLVTGQDGYIDATHVNDVGSNSGHQFFGELVVLRS